MAHLFWNTANGSEGYLSSDFARTLRFRLTCSGACMSWVHPTDINVEQRKPVVMKTPCNYQLSSPNIENTMTQRKCELLWWKKCNNFVNRIFQQCSPQRVIKKITTVQNTYLQGHVGIARQVTSLYRQTDRTAVLHKKLSHNLLWTTGVPVHMACTWSTGR